MPSAKPKVLVRLTRAQLRALIQVANEGIEDAAIRISDEQPDANTERITAQCAEFAVKLCKSALAAAEENDP